MLRVSRRSAGAGINDARGIRDPARQWGSVKVGRRGRPHRHVPMRLYSWAHRRGADGAYIKARKVACWAWGVTPPIGPHSHWSDLFGKMLVRAIKRRTISAKRTQHPTLNTQYSILNTQYSTLNTQHSILNTYHSILNTQYSTLNSQHSILNTQRSTSNTQSSTLNTQHSILCLLRGRRNGVSLLDNQ